jgi:hypothetical protein
MNAFAHTAAGCPATRHALIGRQVGELLAVAVQQHGCAAGLIRRQQLDVRAATQSAVAVQPHLMPQRSRRCCRVHTAAASASGWNRVLGRPPHGPTSLPPRPTRRTAIGRACNLRSRVSRAASHAATTRSRATSHSYRSSSASFFIRVRCCNLAAALWLPYAAPRRAGTSPAHLRVYPRLAAAVRGRVL